jgi:hypothetical protein
VTASSSSERGLQGRSLDVDTCTNTLRADRSGVDLWRADCQKWKLTRL